MWNLTTLCQTTSRHTDLANQYLKPLGHSSKRVEDLEKRKLSLPPYELFISGSKFLTNPSLPKRDWSILSVAREEERLRLLLLVLLTSFIKPSRDFRHGRARTCDHQVKSPMLFQLSYIPILLLSLKGEVPKSLSRGGFEPPTQGVEG